MASSRKADAADSGSVALAAIVERRLRERGIADTTVTVGLSGGVDSVVLLDVMRRIAGRLRIDLAALHVHHGLSPNADAWSDFCRRHCLRRGISFQAIRVEVAGSGSNVEEEARRARFRAFEQHGGCVIALAHNRDDQAETVLLRLLRGGGVRGLSGMPVMRKLVDPASNAAQIIVRPLLDASRIEIERYAKRRRLAWIEDESNADSRYARNFLRNDILPRLELRFPGCRTSLARAASHLAQADRLLREIAEEDARSTTTPEGIDVARLIGLGEARAANALRFALESRGEPPISTEATSELLSQLARARIDSEPTISLSRTTVRRFRGSIVVDTRDGDTAWQSIAWNGQAVQSLPDGTTLSVREAVGEGVSRARLTTGDVSLRRRLGGETLRLQPRGRTRTLKNLLQERAVPPWVRRAMPLLYCGEQLVWVPAVGVAFDFRAQPGEAGLEFDWASRRRPLD